MRSVTNRDSEVGVVGAREGTHQRLLPVSAVRTAQSTHVGAKFHEHCLSASRVAAHVRVVLVSI